MKIALPGLGVAALSALAGCSSPPDPWIAASSYAADAQPGVQSVLFAHSNRAVDAAEELCEPEAPPALEIVTQGRLGAASIRPGSTVVSDPDGPCDGLNLQTTEVVYEAAAGTTGIDTVVYREFRAGGPDLIHTANVRVR